MRPSEYARLAEEEEFIESEKTSEMKRASRSQGTLSTLAVVVCMFCTIFNAISLRSYTSLQGNTFPSSTSFLTSKGVTRKDLNKLRRPSQFIGFDTLHRDHPVSSKSFVNFPMLMNQVDSSQPRKVFENPGPVFSKIGTIYPEHSKMVTSSSVSTILQFRAIDYGMESCQLTIQMPVNASVAEKAPGPIHFSPTDIEIYKVKSDELLPVETLSYSNRPSRGDLIGSTKIGYDTTWKWGFPCEMEHVYSFEVACPASEKDCKMEWTQDKEHGTIPVISVVQHSTI